jgi:hypothetical protein
MFLSYWIIRQSLMNILLCSLLLQNNYITVIYSTMKVELNITYT